MNVELQLCRSCLKYRHNRLYVGLLSDFFDLLNERRHNFFFQSTHFMKYTVSYRSNNNFLFHAPCFE